MIPAIIGALGSLISSGLGIAANAKRDKSMLQQKEEDKAYNDPAAAAARLRSAGFSPSLVGLDGAGTSSPVDLSTSGELFQQAGNSLVNQVQGFASRQLELQRISNTEKHATAADEVARQRVDNETIKLASQLRQADDEHIASLVKSTDNLQNLVLSSYIAGRKLHVEDESLQKQIDDIYDSISVDDADVVLAKSGLEKGTSENELASLVANQQKEYYIENPMQETMKVDRLVYSATQDAQLHRLHLQNRGAELQNDFAESTQAARISDLVGDTSENASKRSYRKSRVSELLYEKKRLEYTISVTPNGLTKRTLEMDLNKVNSALDLLNSGKSSDTAPTNLFNVLPEIVKPR